MSQPQIIILNAAVDEHEGKTVLRGVISRHCLGDLLVDDYQREKLPISSRANIREALEAGEQLPDVELGMRGETCSLVQEDGMNTITLHDPVYLIDGLQRRETILEYLAQNCDAPVRLGALIHFGTTKPWERERFYKLNKHRIAVSPNVLLRNMREDNVVLTMLWGLTHTERTFVMCERVQWGQNMARAELMSASTLVRLAGLLHSHRLPGRSSTVTDVVVALNSHLDQFGIQAMRENLRTFFGLIDECWNIRKVHFKGAAYLKSGFMTAFARVLSDHIDFWRQPDDKRLFIDAPLRRKIGKFPIDDPEILRLAGAGGMAREHLYLLLRDHINSGKRTKLLTARHPSLVAGSDGGDDDDAEAETERLAS